MAERKNIAELLVDPAQGRRVALALLVLLGWLALMLRMSLDFDGVLDTDVVNFGLAGYRFDVLDHQPHPPGYPGYVVLLKLVHLVAPWLDPVALAKWTTRLCGTGVVFAAYWACSELLGGGPEARGRSLVAAGLSVVHPLLWFYGGDGQSHGAEALLTLVLFALAVRVQRASSRRGALLLVIAFALAGSVRPTIPLLASPMLVWVFWRRPLLDWALAALVGVATVAAWYATLVWLSGGLDTHQRATNALVKDMFITSYSVFGDRANARGVLANLVTTGWSVLFSIIPLLALGALGAAWRRPWVRVVLAVFAANAVFYTLMFTAELGYLIQIAALAVLVPATWPGRLASVHRWRLVIVGLACPVLLFAGPASLPVPYSFDTHAPTYPRVVLQSEEQRVYRELMCGVAEGEPTLLLTDNYTTTNSRWVITVCPNIVVGLYIHDLPLNPALDNWLVFFPDGLDEVPPGIPLEPGDPARYEMPPVRRVVVALDATRELAARIAASARCEPARFAPYGDDFTMPAWPAHCFDELALGMHTIVIRSSGEPTFGDGFSAAR